MQSNVSENEPSTSDKAKKDEFQRRRTGIDRRRNFVNVTFYLRFRWAYLRYAEKLRYYKRRLSPYSFYATILGGCLAAAYVVPIGVRKHYGDHHPGSLLMYVVQRFTGQLDPTIAQRTDSFSKKLEEQTEAEQAGFQFIVDLDAEENQEKRQEMFSKLDMKYER